MELSKDDMRSCYQCSAFVSEYMSPRAIWYLQLNNTKIS